MNEKRLRTLRDLALRASSAHGVDDSLRLAVETLCSHGEEFAFVLAYAVEEGARRARLAGAAGIPPGLPLCPEIVDLETRDGGWPLRDALIAATPLAVEDPSLFGTLPAGAWAEPPRSAIVLPALLPGRSDPAALLVAAIRPRKVLDEEDWRFYRLVAAGVSLCLAGAVAGESSGARCNGFEEGVRTGLTQDRLRQEPEEIERRLAERTRALQRHQDRLRALFSKLTLTEQRERRRLAAELHDTLAQMLAVAKMKVTQLDGLIRSPRALQAVAEVEELLESAITYTRTLMAELSPSILYESGLAAAVRWLADQMKRRHGLSVEVEVEEELGAVPEEQAVLIYQTVRELLLNVVRHAGVASAQVRLGREPGGDLHVRVADRGVGFEAADPDRLAETAGPFGLFGVAERIETLGGRFEIDAAPGRGTRVHLAIPSAEARPRWAPGPPPSIAPGYPAPHPKRGPGAIRVIIADDHEMVREGLRTIVESQSDLVVVGEATDGIEALDLVRSHRPDVVIMDVNMPRLNGIEATRLIKQEVPSVAIVGLSVHLDESLAAVLKEAGATLSLNKSGASKELCEALRSAQRELRARSEPALPF